MDFNEAVTATNPTTDARSVFYCPYVPTFSAWEVDQTLLPWFLVATASIASPIAVILNVLVIVAVKLRKELQRLSYILLSSMAVADLLVGAVCLPLSAVVDSFVASEILAEHVCTLELVTEWVMYTISWCSFLHIMLLAWERYVAIQKWQDYKVIVTRSRLNNLAIIAWVFAVLSLLPQFIILAVVDEDDKGLAMEVFYVISTVLAACVLVLMIYFYVMVYFGVRKRKLSEISQVTALVAAKRERKVAKTSALITAALLVSVVPVIVVGMLGGVLPALRKSLTIRVAETLMQLNSVVNPLIYCYRDRCFRNAALELLKIRKPQKEQSAAVSVVRNPRGRANPSGLLEDVVKTSDAQQSIRPESCDLPELLDFAPLEPHKATLKRSLSAPSLAKGISFRIGVQVPKNPEVAVFSDDPR